MYKYSKPILKTIPVLRLLLPLILGICLQYNFKLPIFAITIGLVFGLLIFIAYNFLSTKTKFRYQQVSGISITVVFIAIGALLSFQKNIENKKNWLGKLYTENTSILLTIQEPIVTKAKSYKALAKAEFVLNNNTWQPVLGNVLLYFKKDSTLPQLNYGSQIVVTKKLTPIINSGNPGGFNYAKYCSFQNISYQAFINDGDYIILPTTSKNWFSSVLISAQNKVLSILKNNIVHKNQLSIAQALLIGYKDDLDRDLVESYSNTGVVHIIAISGLHLGMIYGLLIFLFKPFLKYKWSKIVKPITIILVLWLFSFIAGAAPSILRSAVMFTFIVVGDSFNKRTTMYNSLALSAFLLLVINPFSLWDVGFQLSYSAVLSIVVFQKNINQWYYAKNKLLKKIWSLVSVTLSAQILTLPIVLYHFHQFPTLFLITNLFAVPLSGLILYAELLLLAVSFAPTIAMFIGKIVDWLIEVMNNFIVRMDSLPNSIISGLQINLIQVVLLYGVIIGFAAWLITKKSTSFIIGLSSLCIFFIARGIDFTSKNLQQKIIVYNVPNHTAIDLVQQRKFIFIGDEELKTDGFLRNFHLQPSRILHRISNTDSLSNFSFNNKIIYANGKTILIIDDDFYFKPQNPKIKLDAIVLTKNPKIYLSNLHQAFQCNKYIFDSSNPFWKINYWKKDADSLQIAYHITTTQGACIINL